MFKITEDYMRAYYNALEYIYKNYGMEKQKQQLVQELSELIVAITKNDIQNIIEEMADVQVMLDQFMIANPIWDKEIERIKFQKVKRQLERIQKNR